MTTASLLGDSQAGGLAVPLGRELAARNIQTLRHFHRAGASTSVVLASGDLGDVLTRGVPDVLFVALGGNDTPRSQTSWGQLVAEAQRAGIRRIVWIGPPSSPSNSGLDEHRRAISDAQRAYFATKPNVLWLSGRTLAARLPRADDVHLTAAGYVIYARRIAEAAVGSGLFATFVLAAGALLGARWVANWMARSPRRRR